MLTIIAILLFIIAIGNEGSRKVLWILLQWFWILAVFLTVISIAIGIVASVGLFAFSGHPFGPPSAILYALLGLMTANYYANHQGPDFVSLLFF